MIVIKDDKKPIIALILLCLVSFCISGTMALFSSSWTFENLFETAPYNVIYEEDFTSPDDWTPGTETDKEVYVTNESEGVEVVVRLFFDEEWSEGVDGSLENGEGATILNFKNLVDGENPDADWVKVNENGKDYYYYTTTLKPGETTSSVLDSVTFNPNAPSGSVCTEVEILAGDKTGEKYEAMDPNTVVGTKKVCSSNGMGYDDATYKLTVNIETVQADAYKDLWGTDIKVPYYTAPTELYNVVQKDADNSLAIKYTGLGSENYQNDVYVYQDDDYINVLFANYCWKMVRTTETGGVKMIYNGIPVNGTCPNTGTASQLSTTPKFNSGANSLGYLGYMYNSTQGYSRVRLSSSAIAMNKTMVISDTVTDNGDGTYTLANPITVTTDDWTTNYENYKKHFVCSTLTATTCTSLWYLNNTTSTTYTYNIVYKYGNSFEYVLDEVSGQYKYKLLDTKLIYEWSSDYSDFGNYHYTCKNLSDECGSAVYYYNIRADYPYYMTLTNGKSIEDAMNELLWDDNVNTNDSLVKTVIDDWYATNMTSYTKYLEDTVYCNDRRVANFSGWDPNGGIPNADIMFHSKLNRDLTCPNKNDQFTVSSSLGNGKLTYPVGLLTAGEATIAGNEVVGSGVYYWLMSPGVFSIHTAYVYAMSSYGEPDHIPTNYTSLAVGVRPAISLAPQVKFSAGNGSVSTPYIVDLTSVS